MSMMDKIKAAIAQKNQEEQKEPATPEPVKEELPVQSEGSLKSKLAALGANKAVNPPPEQTAVQVNEEPQTVNEAPQTVNTDDPGGKVCPTCGKSFKRLGKHVCKQTVQEQSVSQTPTITGLLENKTTTTETIYIAPACEGEIPPSTGQKTLVIGGKRNEESENKGFIKGELATFHSYILVIDGHVINTKYANIVDARTLCGEAKEAVCKLKGVEHWKMLEYGEGPAQLELQFERWFAQTKFVGIIEIDSRSLEYQSIIKTLKKYAHTIVKG